MAPLLIGALAGGGLGLLNGMNNEKKMDAQNQYRAAAVRYSPWTKMGDPGALNLPDSTSSLFQGAALGGMVGNMMTPDKAATAAAAAGGAPGAPAGGAGSPGAAGAVPQAMPKKVGMGDEYGLFPQDPMMNPYMMNRYSNMG